MRHFKSGHYPLVTSIAGLLLAYWVARKVAKGLLVLAVLGLVAHTLLPTQLGKLVQDAKHATLKYVPRV